MRAQLSHSHKSKATALQWQQATLFVCFNPYCNSRLKCFADEKGYTMHFELSPSCFHYFCDHGKASLKPPAVDINVFECMLRFDEWMNQHTFWNARPYARSKQAAYWAIVTLMEMCKTHIPLTGTKTWKKFPKFHELLHILDDMEWFGAPVNFCA
jgi:hypothetical protein